VPVRLVANQPATAPIASPLSAPARGSSGVGSRPVPPSAFIACTVAKAPMPK
jgi:hypothetical protein